MSKYFNKSFNTQYEQFKKCRLHFIYNMSVTRGRGYCHKQLKIIDASIDKVLRAVKRLQKAVM